MLTLDIILVAEKATLSVLALLAPNLRGLLALCACAAAALAVGMGIAMVDWVERHGRRG